MHVRDSTNQSPVKCGVKTLTEALHKSAGNMIRTSLLRTLQVNGGPKPSTEGPARRNSQSSARAPRQGGRHGAVTCPVPMRPPRPCRSLKRSTLLRVETSSRAATANGSVSAPLGAPSQGNGVISPIWRLLGKPALSPKQGTGPALSPKQGAGLALCPKKGAGPSHAHLGLRSASPGPRAAEEGKAGAENSSD